MNDDETSRDQTSREERDDDLAALFYAQARTLAVPPSSGDRIRAAARQRTEASSAPVDMTVARRASSRQATARKSSRSGTRYRQAPRWFAAAAVLVLAAALLPLTRQAPEQPVPGTSRSLESSESLSVSPSVSPSLSLEDRDDFLAMAPEASSLSERRLEAENVAADSNSDTESDSDSVSVGTVLLPETETKMEAATVAGVGTSASASTDSSLAEIESSEVTRSVERHAAPASGLADQASAKTFSTASQLRSSAMQKNITFRNSASTWLKHIRDEVEKVGVTEALRKEYALFRERHPDYEPDYEPGFDLPTERGN